LSKDAAATAASVKEEAKRVASEVSAQGAKVVEDVKSVGQDLSSAAAGKAEELAERGKQVGAERGAGLANATRRVADDLEGSSPEIARHVRTAADSIESVANSLRERSVGDLMQEATGFARRQPGAFFGAAVLAGFAIARFAKSSADGVPPHHPTGTTTGGYGGTGSTGGYGGAAGSTGGYGGAAEAAGSYGSNPASTGGTSNYGGTVGRAPSTGTTTDRAPGWVPATPGSTAVGGGAGTAESLKPATMAAATLGGAAAHKPGTALPGSMPTVDKTETDKPGFDKGVS
jgi:hypothetical protein